MKILGIDPGSRRMGMAILEEAGPHSIRARTRLIRIAQAWSHPKRCEFVYQTVCQTIATEKPNLIAIEAPVPRPIKGRASTRSAITLGQIRGAIFAAIGDHIDIAEINPATAKKALTGNGRATKGDMLRYASLLTRAKHTEISEDEADAIAIALAAW